MKCNSIPVFISFFLNDFSMNSLVEQSFCVEIVEPCRYNKDRNKIDIDLFYLFGFSYVL